ncbi:RDD family protein [Pararhizobium mangrovi]|uniref:RDD family protein n=1 Tax=Pararhizobium mangrovi TaxID=2590452 RepID=A0A506UE30_9HYPH|nr:RDD family protein [Pararhizobium mangrovi]TPW31858.1 RDD family protein [Pararhizobium mangrovi]
MAIAAEMPGTNLDAPRRYRSVRTRRILAFCIDYTLVLLLCIPVSIVVFFLGIVTLGLGFMLYSVLFALVALPYVMLTMGGSAQATPGMKAMDLRLARLDGGPVDGMLALIHTVLFWAGNVILSPIVLLVSLFSPRKRLLQDFLLGTVVVRRED